MRTRLKILFLTRKWPPAVGGMEAYSRDLARALEAHACVDLRALPGKANGKRPSAFAMIVFGVATAFDILLKGTDADVAHGADLAIWPLVFIATLRRRSVRPVLSAHGSDIALSFKRGLRAALYRLYLKLGVFLLPSVIVLANSRATADLCARRGFAHVRIVHLATLAADDECLAPEPFILFVGRLIPQKGCGWFIREVLPLLDERLRFAVAGIAWDEEEEAALSHPRVRFHGPVFGAALRDLRARATAIVVPNLDLGLESFEGFGLTATEGAADGGVVLACDLHGIADAVRHGTTGFLMQAGDAAAWAAKIHEIAAWSQDERKAFIAASRAAVARIYSWPRVADETLAAYRAGGERSLAAPAVSKS